ncbi:MAG TPA: ScpA family protein [Ktedonobacterales bacterium]
MATDADDALPTAAGDPPSGMRQDQNHIAHLALGTTSASTTGASTPHGAAPYQVRLPIFEGPLDLLLHLIEKNQLEITAVSLVAVTDQFIAYLRMWDEPPMPRLAEFVAMAARLLLIKSRSLLPRQPRQEESDGESDPLDDAEALRRHLIEYKLAREIARSLRARELAGLQSFTRPGRLLVDAEAMLAWSPPKVVGLNVQALAHVFKRVLTEQRFAEPEQLPLPLITIAEQIEAIERLLRERGRIAWEDLLRTLESRFALVVTFLAMLELLHQSRVEATQDDLFGPILIVPGPRFAAAKTETELTLDSYSDAEEPQA